MLFISKVTKRLKEQRGSVPILDLKYFSNPTNNAAENLGEHINHDYLLTTFLQVKWKQPNYTKY